MPSPVGHALAGVAAGWAMARPATPARALVVQTVAFALLATAPDLDLIIGRHSGQTHSLGAAAVVASVAAWQAWPLAAGRWRVWVAAFAAWATHPLLDALSPDTSVPIGIMAFWPISSSYVQTGLAVFAPIWRDWRAPHALTHDAWAVLREIAILLPIVAAVWWGRQRVRIESSPR